MITLIFWWAVLFFIGFALLLLRPDAGDLIKDCAEIEEVSFPEKLFHVLIYSIIVPFSIPLSIKILWTNRSKNS